jgi:hypothetical protein
MVRWDARNMAAALGRVGVPLMVIQSTMMTPERKRVPLPPGATTPWLEMIRSRAPHARSSRARRRALHDAQRRARNRLSRTFTSLGRARR